MKFIDILKESFRTYKEKLADSALFGLISSAIGITFMIPIVGAFIYSYFYPKILRWFAKKVELLEREVDLKPAFLALLIRSILIHAIYVYILMLLWNWIIGGIGDFVSFLLNNLGSFIILFIIVAVIWVIVEILLEYTIYANVIGILEEFKIFPLKSFKLFLVIFIVGVGLGIIQAAFSMIPIGNILVVLFQIIVGIPLPNIVALRYVKEL